MSERDRSQGTGAPGDADRTLLGVAPPKLETSLDSAPRSPVFVRAGTSVVDQEPPPLPRMALPVRLPALEPGAAKAQRDRTTSTSGVTAVAAELDRALDLARRSPVTWMVLAPLLISVVAATALYVRSPRHTHSVPRVSATPVSHEPAPPASPALQKATAEGASSSTLANLAKRAPESLSSRELVILAESRFEQQRARASVLRNQLDANPALATDKATQLELLRLAQDSVTAREAMAAMAAMPAPVGPDLLYQVWTESAARTDATELARALLYSTDVRPHASPALAVALELRTRETCLQVQEILPKALTDGDRRSLHPLAKLVSRRGCGPKKAGDCFSCLRSQGDELVATINAVKSRRPPSYPTP